MSGLPRTYTGRAIELITRFAPLNHTASRNSYGWSIGYMCRDDIGRLKIFPGQVVTAEEAKTLMIERADHAMNLINEHVTADISQNEIDALVCHVYFFPQMQCFASSVLLEHLNSGDKMKAADAILNDSVDDRHLRRVAEVHLFMNVHD